MLRIIISFVVAFVAATLGERGLIPLLRCMRARQPIKEIGSAWHMSKQGAPIMGGLMLIIGSAAVVLLLGWSDFATGRFDGGFVLLFALVFGTTGYIDDYMRMKEHQNIGLTAPQKSLLRLAAATMPMVLMRNHHYLTPNLYILFMNVTLSLPWPAYAMSTTFVMVGTVNAVNITDDIDSLATSVTIPVMFFFTAVACSWRQLELGIFSIRLFGGLCGFLIYNFHPAKVFMSSTGSLFLGGVVHGLAFALGIPLVLISAGIIYILETLSDILRVGYFKLTCDKQIFRTAPLHHRLELGGQSEVKLSCMLPGVTLLACVLTFLGVVGR